jgi:putative oxidoreductase
MMRGIDLRPDWGLVPLRLVVGVVFIAHGWLKLSSFGIPGTAKFMGDLGIPMPAVAAICIITLELIGGIGLVLGGGTRLLAALLSADMLGAIFFAKRNAGFFAPNGWELELTLFAACVTLAIVGAGGASIDAAFRGHRGPGKGTGT